jgi:hypothetical protein
MKQRVPPSLKLFFETLYDGGKPLTIPRGHLSKIAHIPFL